MSAYDVIAPTFDRHRAIPDAALEAIRAAMLNAVGPTTRPRFLDIGAGTGRIGLPFVVAGNDYVGVDLSLGMLRQFVERARLCVYRSPHLVQSDGQHLPFRDAAFDAVMLIQVFGGLHGWRRVLTEVRRVVSPAGAVIVGRSAMPESGLDAQMKRHLAVILSEMGVLSDKRNVREDAMTWLAAAAESNTCAVAAAWDVERTPRGFLSRHQGGASFSYRVKKDALSKLSAWATATFGSLDVALPERHSFELRIFKFPEKGARQRE
jgi:ubiquinone/menaquinone biosynthesis C-methylase UbiE